MLDTYTGKKITRAMGSLWPAPAVQYHMASGRVARVSFWAPSKATPQELIERGVSVACRTIYYHGTMRADKHGVPYGHDDRIMRLYVEDKAKPGPFHAYEGEIDPWNPSELSGVKPTRITVKQVKTVLADVLSILDGGLSHDKAKEVLAQAEELLAA